MRLTPTMDAILSYLRANGQSRADDIADNTTGLDNRGFAVCCECLLALELNGLVKVSGDETDIHYGTSVVATI